ncbi:uncharacterized protein BDW43DRAFT_311339 [Aspergillus alliaceus]|uniref:uncharacterized protein n=1 Tax=Petromyces alliaceus TaxID=209559 RepID=UPI0012A55FD7|nr:uncharacterized protein BDW43DRAFT_311339 [Aspergillus alliaceus]KAB8233261.1 hypothetical protein BDW43DRAFT_311339 [Aspergillus alliaceus]
MQEWASDTTTIVAWIYALPLEMTAAKVMLDEVHPSLPQPETDHNVYTLGNVTGPDVVVCRSTTSLWRTLATIPATITEVDQIKAYQVSSLDYELGYLGAEVYRSGQTSSSLLRLLAS